MKKGPNDCSLRPCISWLLDPLRYLSLGLQFFSSAVRSDEAAK
jgi:hypothetical protein